ncbi:STAS domain-containing protein [Actinoplanes xinjiangensis]|uniref:STAS domain-containing protein n=1 Tax=Actinoplanes xinjiangensis TaxID=512350 RepID=UPI003443A96F
MDQEHFTISSQPCRLNPDGIRECLILLTGEVDLAARDELRDTLLAVIDRERPDQLVVDLAEVTFLDSEAIGALLDGYLATLITRTVFQLTNANTMIRRVLQILDLQELLCPGS